ncbi:MAG: flagellar filament capping protein FliD [Spirochaetales bacterium]|nr:flagellar filament capping protein FliD [Spirochaetales bacterium]
MADSGSIVPGLSNKYNSQATIEKIMNKKREKVDKMNDEKKKIDETRQSIGEVSQKVLSLDKSAKRLYGTGSSFENKIGESSSSQIATKIEKTADRGEYSINVIEKASSHKIASIPLNKNFKIDSGNYQISSAGKTVNIRFSGGNIEKFHKEILDQAKDVVKSSIISNTSKTRVLVLESKAVGENSEIVFSNDNSKDLFKKMGFFSESFSVDKSYFLNADNENPFVIEKDQSCALDLSGEELPKNTSVYIDLDLSVSPNIDLAENIDNDNIEQKNSSDAFSEVGKSSVMGVELPGDKFILNLPEKKLEETTSESINENDVIAEINNNYTKQSLYSIELETTEGRVPIEDFNLSEMNETFSFRLDEKLPKNSKLLGISFKNIDSETKLNVGKIRLYTENQEGSENKIVFANELEKPQDAVLELDGLRVTRKSNVIDDLLKGVSLTILDKTDGDVSLNVDFDYSKMVGDITEFLAEYNQLIDMINTRTSFVGSSETLSDEDKENKKGSLSSESELRNLSLKLRTIIMNSYPTKYGAEFSMLSQIGISTNETGGGNKFKGLLEFDEDKFIDKFIEVMEKYPDGVKELFAKDTNQDFIPDTGIAVEINNLLKGYMQKSTGFFDMRDDRLKRMKENKQKEIDKYEEKLVDEERKLREQFLKMEQAGQELEDSRKKFDNLNK